jgi:hypothetical protein
MSTLRAIAAAAGARDAGGRAPAPSSGRFGDTLWPSQRCLRSYIVDIVVRHALGKKRAAPA